MGLDARQATEVIK